MDSENVDSREAQVFVWIIMKYIMKSTDKVLPLLKVYCEIDIA